eukprot:SAG31_NODE_2857_length_4991_cov_51.196443_3_plen_40_part_00
MIDYAGPRHAGFAVGLNETAGYVGASTVEVSREESESSK